MLSVLWLILESHNFTIFGTVVYVYMHIILLYTADLR